MQEDEGGGGQEEAVDGVSERRAGRVSMYVLTW